MTSKSEAAPDTMIELVRVSAEIRSGTKVLSPPPVKAARFCKPIAAALVVDAPAVAGNPKTCWSVKARLVASPLTTGKTLILASAEGNWSN